MDKFRLSSFLCLLMGAVFLLLHCGGSTSQEDEVSDARKINLALRQAAHELYKSQGDTTSRIPPVTASTASTYTLRLNRFINYDTLPSLLDAAFSDFQIERAYEVAIRSCWGDTLLLGYNFLAFQQREIPCLGRDQAMACNILEVSFEETPQQANFIFLSLAILSFIGSLLIWLAWSRLPTTAPSTPPASPRKREIIQIGSAIFDPKNLMIQFRDEQKKLTFREAKLLEYLATHPNEILKREEIQDHVWKEEGTIVGRSLDVFISRLRKILKPEPGISIKNIHGVGYRLEID